MSGNKLARWSNYVLLSLITFIILYPMLYMVLNALRSTKEIMLYPTRLWPADGFQWSNYAEAFRVGKVSIYLLNSITVTGITLLCQLIVVTLAAYALGKWKPPGHKVLFVLFLATLMITSEMTTIPVFLMLREFELLNTHQGLILAYVGGGIGMAIYLIKNFVDTLPKEVDEAARMDGAGLLRVFWYIDLPLIVPVLAVVTIMSFVGVWSEFFWALITITDDRLKTLPLGLLNFQSQYNTNYGVLLAGLTIVTIPSMLVYLLFSRYFIEGMTAGSIKG
ncbi:carbohydrate ABC transporter permease [Paenibacillus sp. J5C_2022]|uniref:carbohydrate ABC transporter permease n=1 Tax=Paenibacillus sp. J5C2022 TaxID=2977129 RepID=UPI0021CEB4C2|nr:carbohydrate ABC transporter permease [Paenibacillus sp. J5C2022]MCU6709960.1 carbohydrate ABC transporter permease [Paenibacillus sp. J5C2022]